MTKVSDTVEKSVTGAVKTASTVVKDVTKGAKSLATIGVKATSDSLNTVTDTTAKVAIDATEGTSGVLKTFFKDFGDDIMQLVCVVLLGVILIMINPANSAVVFMRKWWVRMLAVIFLVLVLFAERDKPRVSILLGLVILALILFSDMPFSSDSFYGRVPSGVEQLEEEEGEIKQDMMESDQMTQQEPLPADDIKNDYASFA